jgi:hypothetical protein
VIGRLFIISHRMKSTFLKHSETYRVLDDNADVKVYANNLYDGDILAAECSNSPSRGGTTAPRPMPPASANEGNTKFQQQRAMAAQVRV